MIATIEAPLTYEQVESCKDSTNYEMIKRKFLEQKLYLCESVAKAYHKNIRNLSFNDMVNEGYLGLVDYYDSYNPDKGKFDTYMIYGIKERVRLMLNNDRVIKQNISHVQIHEHIKRLQSQGMRPEEIQEKLKLSPKKYNRIVQNLKPNISVNSKKKGEDNDCMDMAGRECTPLQEIINKERAETLDRRLNGLDDRERLVMELRFKRDNTLSEIGDMLGGMTPEGVRQIQKKALSKLKCDALNY